MKTKNCGDCVYARRGSGRWLRVALLRWPGLLICANSADAPGDLQGVPATGSCRNFRRRRGPVLRLKPPDPPNDEIRYIPLTRGKYAIVDATDYEWLSRYKWFANGNEENGFYAARWLPGYKLLLMHRAIMDPPDGMIVDHIDGQRHNNRRANLRVCTWKENVRNGKPSRSSTSRFKGVHRDRKRGKWVATIACNAKTTYLGSFDDEIEAAKAYDRKARELFGEFAYLNFPDEV
ncbi:MAG: HNH endonuclease [Phycisphaerales bacterium]|nr:MAG: HNH endonuclease [Phycisphaerales bacterium]